MRKGARLIIGRYSGGVVFDALTPTASSGQALALSPRERGQKESPRQGDGTKGKPPQRGKGQYEDEEVSGTGFDL